MNNDQIDGKWTQFKGKLKEAWGNLTDDDLDLFNGKKDQFFGKLQEHYGIGKDEAQRRIDSMDPDYGKNA